MNDSIPFDIDVDATRTLISESKDVTLLDCRTPSEREIAHIRGSLFIPMNELSKRVTELPTTSESRLIVYCHLGGRSAMVTEWLRENGFPTAQNMAGGIDAWSVSIDGNIPRYS